MRVLVTGSNGFLGQNLIEILQFTYPDVIPVDRWDYDLTITEFAERMFSDHNPDVVVHLAAYCGGIDLNRRNPGLMFYDNMMMGLNVIEQARISGIDKVVFLGSVCSYPVHAPVPFSEDDLWNGYPEETNSGYGVVKKSLGVMLKTYKQQYDLDSAYLVPVNMYGPYDHFNHEDSHVIPAMILKITEAQESDSTVTLWGTGSASREFLYVQDCARAIVKAIETSLEPEPINIGTGSEITIKQLAYKLCDLMKFDKDRIVWDETKPDGQPRRCLDIDRAKTLLGFEPMIDLDTGLELTIKYFNNTRK